MVNKLYDAGIEFDEAVGIFTDHLNKLIMAYKVHQIKARQEPYVSNEDLFFIAERIGINNIPKFLSDHELYFTIQSRTCPYICEYRYSCMITGSQCRPMIWRLGIAEKNGYYFYERCLQYWREQKNEDLRN